MSWSGTIRLADPYFDAAAVATIYRPAVERSAASFEQKPPELGAWHDVAWYGMRLSEPGVPPAEPGAPPVDGEAASA